VALSQPRSGGNMQASWNGSYKQTQYFKKQNKVSYILFTRAKYIQKVRGNTK
jgi:hypothetical protein